MNHAEVANNAAAKFDENWIAKNGRDDFGTCGSAVVLIGFGRLRKLKDEALASGVIKENNTWERHGKKYYVAEYPRVGVPTQNIDYFEGKAEAVRDALRESLPGADIFVHSWMD